MCGNPRYLLLGVILCYFATRYAVAEYSDLCLLFKNGTILRKPGTWSEYLTCVDEEAISSRCSLSTFYDSSTQSCEVYPPDGYYENRCEGLNNKWITDPHTCQGYIYCQSGRPKQGYCAEHYVFDEDAQMCVFEDKSSCFVAPNLCELVPDKTLYRDAKQCGVYYECNGGKKKTKKCTSKYFNKETGKCEEKSLVDDCTVHKKPKCKKTGGFYADGATCRGYYYCRAFGIDIDKEPLWYQCPEGYFFDAGKQQCTEPVNAKCTYNRCQGRGNMLVQASNDDCRGYVMCENGVQVKKYQCGGDYFFDEKFQACVPWIVEYNSCLCTGKKCK